MTTLYDEFNKYHNTRFASLDANEQIDYLLKTSRIIDEITKLDHNKVYKRSLEVTKGNKMAKGFDDNGFKVYYEELIRLVKEYFDAIEEDDFITPTDKCNQYYPKHHVIEGTCPRCGEITLTNSVEGDVCLSCGHTESSYAEAFACSYLERVSTQPDTITRFLYKRDHYFFIKIHFILGTNYKSIPQELIDRVIIELYKSKPGRNLMSLTYKDVRVVLSKLGYQKHFDSIYGIIRFLRNGIGIVDVPDNHVETLIGLADDCIIAFDAVILKLEGQRKNFISYNYCTFKLLELLRHRGFEDIRGLEHIHLLKKEKVEVLDRYWQKICEYNSWPFFDTVV